jgi:hypothetical protein
VVNNHEEAPLVIEALQQPLLKALNETDTHPPVKNEDLAWQPFVLTVVYYFIAGKKKARSIITKIKNANHTLGLPKKLKKNT